MPTFKTPGESRIGGESPRVFRKVSHHFIIKIILYLEMPQIKYNQKYNLVSILMGAFQIVAAASGL
jgi:hypothetical protein